MIFFESLFPSLSLHIISLFRGPNQEKKNLDKYTRNKNYRALKIYRACEIKVWIFSAIETDL
jgi:hypothetical protein